MKQITTPKQQRYSSVVHILNREGISLEELLASKRQFKKGVREEALCMLEKEKTMITHRGTRYPFAGFWNEFVIGKTKQKLIEEGRKQTTLRPIRYDYPYERIKIHVPDELTDDICDAEGEYIKKDLIYDLKYLYGYKLPQDMWLYFLWMRRDDTLQVCSLNKYHGSRWGIT